jgi:copper resistance protein B
VSGAGTLVVRTSILLCVCLAPGGLCAQSAGNDQPHDGHAGHAPQVDVRQQSTPPAPEGHVHPPATEGGTAAEEKPGLKPRPTDLKPGPTDLPAFIPKLTDADRQAAFPDLGGHPLSNPIRSFVLVERLEFQASEEGGDAGVNAVAWIGRERNRLWLRAEGSSDGGRTDEAQAHVLWGWQFARWWDLVAGIRQDFQPGDAQTWAAVGVQGLSPYWFEIELTGYAGAAGRTQARIDLDYELLLTNRWILQPRVEVSLAGKSDPERQLDAGLTMTDIGLRLRYELRREFAPYLGVMWRRKWQGTADLAEEAGESTGGPRFVAGLRVWW